MIYIHHEIITTISLVNTHHVILTPNKRKYMFFVDDENSGLILLTTLIYNIQGC